MYAKLLRANYVRNRRNYYDKNYIFGVCEGRHEIPQVENYLFGHDVDPVDVASLYNTVATGVPSDADHIDLYVTGLTAAIGAVVAYCTNNAIGLTLWHYNRDTAEYYPQDVISVEVCPFCGGRTIGQSYYCPHCGSN